MTGDPVLRATMAVEELGSGKDSCTNDGLGRGHLFRSREEAEEKAASRLSCR